METGDVYTVFCENWKKRPNTGIKGRFLFSLYKQAKLLSKCLLKVANDLGLCACRPVRTCAYVKMCFWAYLAKAGLRTARPCRQDRGVRIQFKLGVPTDLLEEVMVFGVSRGL